MHELCAYECRAIPGTPPVRPREAKGRETHEEPVSVYSQFTISTASTVSPDSLYYQEREILAEETHWLLHPSTAWQDS